MKFTIRDILWLTMVVAIAVGWFVDHRRLQWQIMLNDWAWEMHPEGGRNVTSGAGGGATFFVSPVPPAVMPSDVTDGKSPRPFSFLGEPISESNFEPQSAAKKAGEDGPVLEQINREFFPLQFDGSAHDLREHLGQPQR